MHIHTGLSGEVCGYLGQAGGPVVELRLLDHLLAGSTVDRGRVGVEKVGRKKN